MKRMKKTGGFTLIELLVVIAIIGILSSVVLVSLNSARNKGKDTRVISDVNQIRTVIETLGSGSNYQAALGSAVKQNGTGTTTLAANDTSSSTPTLLTDATNNGGYVGINFDGNTKYVVFGQLPSNTSKVFCVDSTGNTNPATSTPTTGYTCN